MYRFLLAIALCISVSYARLVPVVVTKVIDGDTYKADLSLKTDIGVTNIPIVIRLARTDTPESIRNNKAYKDAYKQKSLLEYEITRGKAIKKAIKQAILGKIIWLLPDNAKNKDRYGRDIYWVFISSNISENTCLNLDIVRSGYAHLTYTKIPLPPELNMFTNTYPILINARKSVPIKQRLFTYNDLVEMDLLDGDINNNTPQVQENDSKKDNKEVSKKDNKEVSKKDNKESGK